MYFLKELVHKNFFTLLFFTYVRAMTCSSFHFNSGEIDLVLFKVYTVSHCGEVPFTSTLLMDI